MSFAYLSSRSTLRPVHSAYQAHMSSIGIAPLCAAKKEAVCSYLAVLAVLENSFSMSQVMEFA